MKNIQAAITAVHGSVPEKVLSNADLEIASKHYACGIAGISMFNQSS